MMAPTPLEAAPDALRAGRPVFLKREDVHELGAFKWRGALPTLEAWSRGGERRVVTASTGNHGAATAWAARRLGMQADVYVPEVAARAKTELIASLGATIHRAGDDIDDAKEAAREHASVSGAPFFEDGNEHTQYEGYRSIGREILDQLPAPPGAVVVPVGNGALLGGVGLEIAEHSPRTARIGVQAAGAPVMAECWHAGEVVETDRCDTIADGLAIRVAIPLAVEVLGEVATDMAVVSEAEIARAVGAYAAAGIRAEGAAAAALAALPRVGEVDGPVVVVVTGRNIDDELWQRACESPESFPA